MLDKVSIRVLLVDDHAILRSGLRKLLEMEAGLEVVGEAGDGKEAIYLTGQLKPDLIISDLSMPKSNGTEAIKQIKNRYPDTQIIVLTVHKTEEHVRAALEAGVNGYLLKDDKSEELMAAIKNVKAGKIHLSPGICGNVVLGFLASQNSGEITSSIKQLTTREREVMKLIAEGYRNKDIAQYLSISEKTVEKHRSNMMKKTNLHNTSEITSFAIKNGIASA